MITYNPSKAPNPKEWLQLDEQERFTMVEDYHASEEIELPSPKLHAIMHAIVENQLAENDEPVVRALTRLLKQGLTRHDAIHAISSVVAEHIFDLLKSKDDAPTSNARYYAQIERLNAAQWWKGAL